MQPSFGCMGILVCDATRFKELGYFPISSNKSQRSPPNQPMVGRGTLGRIDYSKCLPGPPA